MKIEFENSIRRLSFLCHLPDIKIALINPWYIENMFPERFWSSFIYKENFFYKKEEKSQMESLGEAIK